MKSVTVIIYEEAFLTAVASVLDLLTTANQLLEKNGKNTMFDITLAAEHQKYIQMELPAGFTCQKTLDEIKHTDLIIVPAFKGDRKPLAVLEKNQSTVQWIQKMYKKGTEVASLCFGCFFLAEAGLLKGKSCTSHWMAIEGLQKRYPDIKVNPDVILTDEEGIYTGGGGFSSLNLLSYIISKFCGREIAIQISKLFSIDLDRLTQSHFFVFQGQRRHEDDAIQQAQTYIEEHYNNEISIKQVAAQYPMSQRSFIRRFKKATQYTPQQYLQRVKIEAAKKRLERREETINEVMYLVGYNSPHAFRTVFKRVTGLTPKSYKDKYSVVY